MKRLLSVVLFCTLLLSGLSAHPWKPSNYVIIDVDGGVDDMRALSLMLASHDVRVLAVIASPGSLSAENAYIKVKSYLNACHHEGIPVGINRDVNYKSPNYPIALEYQWGDEQGIDPSIAPPFYEVVKKMISAESTPIRFISLGGLSSAYYILKNEPLVETQVKEFVWSSDGAYEKNALNYNIDKVAADYMLKQTDKPLSVVVGKSGISNNFYDGAIISSLDNSETIYAKKIASFLKTTPKEHASSFTAYDEMVPVFLHYPELFTKRVINGNTEYTPNNRGLINERFITIINGHTIEENQVFADIPTDPSFYMEDIQPYVTDIIEKYGHEEWTSGVLASELHRHLGVFAIIGVKMGIRAREYFNTGVDEFTALSYAGSTPPLSCMNDGVQVSTGATPGHGLLTVKQEGPFAAQVDFTYLNTTIRVSLLPDIQQKIQDELKEINFIYGLDSNIYWELVRKNTLKYWQQFDRHEIFNIEVLSE